MRSFVKKQKGLTLIALVVTIIVLIILAGVSINMLVGENGIINMAQRAKNETEQAQKEEEQALASAFERNYATYNGQLHVNGAYLKNSFNEDIQLKGIYYGYGNSKYSKAILTTLKNWGINMIKVGYSYSGGTEPWNKEGNMDSLYQFIDDCIELDLYVDVIFWSGNNLYEANYDKTNEANQFFTSIANRYESSNNIIYEICNEPFENTWEEIKTYSNNVIDTIRNINSNAIILVPNVENYFSILYNDSTIDRENIMYTAHIYSDNVIEKQRTIVEAILRGIPVFISEWSNGNASATGYDNEITGKLTEIFNKYNISNSAWYFAESEKIQTELPIIKNEYFNEVVETGKIENYMLGITGTYLKTYLAQQGRSIYNYSEEDYTWLISYAEDSKYFFAEKYANNIVKFITQSNMDIPSDFVDLWDISHNGMGTVIAYLVPNEEDKEKYDLYICSDKKIIANNIMGGLLRGKFTSLESVDFSNLDTKNVESFYQTFSGCFNLKEITGIDKFDTRNVNTMYKTFQNCYDLRELDLSSWDTNKVTNTEEMFVSCSSLEILNLKNADFSNVTNYNNMFYGINENVTIYVKDDNAKQWITQALSQSGISTDTADVIVSE